MLAFLILTYFEVVIGELVPKTFAIQIAEPMALFFARPITIFYKMTYPLNWVLSRSSRVITGLFGLKKYLKKMQHLVKLSFVWHYLKVFVVVKLHRQNIDI